MPMKVNPGSGLKRINCHFVLNHTRPRAIMVSDFIDEHSGYLCLRNKK